MQHQFSEQTKKFIIRHFICQTELASSNFTDNSCTTCTSKSNRTYDSLQCSLAPHRLKSSTSVSYITDQMKKSAQRDANTARQKFFAPPQTPFPGAQNRQNLLSWRWSLPAPTDPVWWRSMDGISSYRGNRHRPPARQKHCPPVANTARTDYNTLRS